MVRALLRHWPEYLMEAACVGLAMTALSIGLLALFHPDSPVLLALPNLALRRGLMGFAMAATSLVLVYSPWGRQSGAHFNPAVTLTFYRLGRIPAVDGVWYILSQTVGAIAAFSAVHLLARNWLSAPAIHHLTSQPGHYGAGVAWLAEVAIVFLLMSIVLVATNSPRWASRTGWFVAILVAINASLSVPLLGTSMNPARSVAAALPAGAWTAIWVYLTAPPLGMLLAAECYRWRRGPAALFCAKLHHDNDKRCIFCESRGEAVRRATTGATCNPLAAAASNRTTLVMSSLSSADRQEQAACPSTATTTSSSSAAGLAAARSPTSSPLPASECS